MINSEAFANRIVEAGFVIDPDGVHHEFADGDHGQKVDFDSIPDDHPLFNEWVGHVAATIDYEFPADVMPRDRLAIVSIANGTNRIIEPVAEALEGDVIKAFTEKVTKKTVALTDESRELLIAQQPAVVVAIEDTSTTGGTIVSAIKSIREADIKSIERYFAVVTWQRTWSLPALALADVDYVPIVKRPLPTHKPMDCKNLPDGFCRRGWKLIPHGQK